MEEIKIKKAARSDVKKLQLIGRQTFEETFSESNTSENMEKYLDEGFSIDKLMEELSCSDSEFYFALSQEEVVGYLKINLGKSQTELQEEQSLEIERIYVLKDFHGKKVGQILYEQAMEIARRTSAVYVWLGVWEENPRAINFYKKNGFVEFDEHVFILGTDQQIDIMMKKNL